MVRQSKKLTDCPENLRESIDWLIQVKHGNGGGLDKLAEALKRLIQKAIDDATSSLEKRKKELECPEKSSSEESFCQSKQDEIDKLNGDESKKSKMESDLKKHYNEVHYLTQDARQCALNDIDARRVSLGTLAGQFSGFIGGGQEVKDAILHGLHSNVNQLIKRLQASCGDKGCCKTKTTEIEKINKKVESSDENDVETQFNDLQHKLSEIEKEIAENINKLNTTIQRLESEKAAKKDALSEKDSKSLNSHNASKKSLDTLQKLCGYANKIPSSQNNPRDLLDKLCTGIQTFLGYDNKSNGYTGSGIVYSDLDRLCDGVMAFLHGVLSAAKENENVTKYDNNGDKLVEVLKGLETSIGKGSGAFGPQVTAVSGWLGRYESEVNKKCEAVTNGINALSDNLSKGYSNVVDSKKVDSLKDQLASWESTVSDISREVKNIEEDKVSELDKALKERVMGEMKVVKKAVGMLLGAAGEDGLEKQVQTVDKTLERTKNEIKRDIKEKFSKIDESVRKLGGTKNKQIGHLNDRLKDARDFLDRYNQDYKTEIERLFTQLHGRMNNINPHHPDPAGKESELKKKFTAVTEAVDGIEKAYKDKFADVKKKVDAAVDQALEKDMQHSLDKLDDHIRTDLEGLRNSIKLKLEAFAGSLGTKIKEAAKLAKGSGREMRVLKPLLVSLEVADRRNRLRRNYAVGGTIEGVLYNLRRLEEVSSGTAVYAELLATVRKSLYAAIDKVLKGVIMDPKSIIKFDTAFMSNYYKETKKEDGTGIGTFRGLIMTIKSEFGKGIERPDPNGDVSVDPTKFESQFNYKTDDGQGAKDKYDQAKQAISPTIIDELEALPQQVDAKRKEAVERMSALYTELNNKFNYIYELVHKASGAIDISITSLQSTLNSSQEACLTSVSQAFQTLTTEVRALFAQGHKADLAALKTLVDGQKGEIDGIIFNDKISGIKGLLSALNTHNDKISRIPVGEFKYAAEKSKHYLDAILDYIRLQVRTPAKAPGQDPELSDESKKVWNVSVRLDALLNYLKDDKPHPDDPTGKRIYTFDHQSGNLLASLTFAVDNLTSPNFHGFHNPLLLDAIRSGMHKFTEQLGHAYVNKYSGQKRADDWVETKQSADKKTTETQLTTEGRNCAKVCLTILETLNTNLGWLRKACKKYNNAQINLANGNKLGAFFQHWGYILSEESKQNGEVKNHQDRNGQYIYNLLTKEVDKAGEKHKLVSEDDDNKVNKDKHGLMRKLHAHLGAYYKVCHHEHIDKPKAPSNIYQMLQWLLGLYFDPIYDELKNYIEELFTGLKEEYSLNTEALEVAVPDKKKDPIKSPLDAIQLIEALRKVCLYSEDTLAAILGRGHEEGRYAVDFFTNQDKLNYPNSAASCFDMLVDILSRVYHQLNFLYTQCRNGPSSSGWQECWYGRSVGGSSWNCNTFQCPDQTCKQKHDQKAGQHYECGIKSPLQSYLEDGLPGFLPHSFKTPGCKLTCTLSNHRGLPCKTPMGFSDISVTASHTQNGEYLRRALHDFCGPDSNLNKLCSMLTCVLRRPPQTLGDIFAFYHKFLENWEGGPKKVKTLIQHKHDAFSYAVNEAYFGEKYADLDITPVFGSSSHYDGNSTHPKGDLFSLVSCQPHANPVHPCGRYLQSLDDDIRVMYSDKHAKHYLSWIIYTTETLYDLLKKLYKECCDKCDKKGTKCHKSCDEKCAVKLAYEAAKSDTQKATSTAARDVSHEKSCHSIVKCANMHPTLYAYGFTFGSPHELGGAEDVQTRRTCKDLCNTLMGVISDKETDNAPLAKLIYVTIPEYIWAIRTPFSYLLLALWSLSLLYLLHITVVRLDVLRIRSHLRSPSSHRISAQSLFAAARINSLGMLRYFSP
ncbi:hypothetical protein, conserved [Babesia ovata]|uniref:C3H1-type domain-containing protein n=1 Tax=Babesia ovata TaxID=189622 RepID=A0A2H6K7G9_9APIC|nr:uncharacterized protein BOVATA_004360 [Babesia ovata]GBE58943.1 hypothetical protein, conserved [Babesia ovata]